MRLFRIVLPYACFGGVIENGVITEVAPIGKWMVGLKPTQLRNFLNRKQGEITIWKYL